MRYLGLALCCLMMAACLQKKIPAEQPSGLVRVFDTRLYYRVIGHGEPLLILHGGPGFNHMYLLPHLRQLAETHQLIFFDQRGCGRSEVDVDTASMNLTQLVEDIEFLRAHFGLEELNLMGHGWGGSLAMRYAQQYPDHMNKLILLHPIPQDSTSAHIMDSILFRRSSPDNLTLTQQWMQSTEYETGQQRAYANLLRLHFEKLFYYPHYLDSLQFYIPGDEKDRQDLQGYIFKDAHYAEWIDPSKALYCPTLLLYGSYDYIPREAINSIETVCPNLETVKLPYCGHFSFIEAPEQFGRIVRQFMRKPKM